MRRCQTCGTSLDGRSPRARYCSDLCRARGKRGYSAPTLVVDQEPDEVVVEDLEPLTLEEIAAELRRTLRDRSTPASTKAGLARELRATMEAIAAQTPPAKDGIDELFEARRRKSGT